MAEHFDDLQAVWRAYRPDAGGIQPAAVAAALERHTAREQRMMVAKMIVPVLALCAAVGWLFSGHGRPMLVGVGVLWSIAATAVVLGLEWRRYRSLSRLDFAAPSAEFVDTALGLLHRYQAGATGAARTLTWNLIGGLNVTALGVAEPRPPAGRIVLHILCIAVPLIAYHLGNRVRRRRIDAGCAPLIDQLRSARRGLTRVDI